MRRIGRFEKRNCTVRSSPEVGKMSKFSQPLFISNRVTRRGSKLVWVHVIFIVLSMTFRNPISPTMSVFSFFFFLNASLLRARSYGRINFKSEALEMFNFIVYQYCIYALK